MPILDDQQQQCVLKLFNKFLNARTADNSRPLVEYYADFDRTKISLITNDLCPLLEMFVDGAIPLEEFKSKVDGFNKRNNFWGFSGMKGQMFFNMLVNAAVDMEGCRAELQAALTLPDNEEVAKSRLRTLASYVRRVGDELVAGGGTGFKRPRESSVAFFLSYFWHINAPGIWPVMYTVSCDAMTVLNLWQKSGDLADDYILFKRIHEELMVLFSQHTHMTFELYKVEHVFWFMQKRIDPEITDPIKRPDTDSLLPIVREQELPDSYAPPIVAILPQLACPDDAIKQMAANSGISVPKAFEKSVHAAFTILGFNTKLLGQGTGREPDGLALNVEDSYAIIWDAKSRVESYSLGSHDDRAIREYITKKSRDLHRQYRNIYFLIISGSFQSDFSDIIMELKMDTEIKEVCLVEAEALVAMVEMYLQTPRDFSLGSDGLQRVFANRQGIITKQFILELFG